MKTKISLFMLLSFCALIFVCCKKDADKIELEAPTITSIKAISKTEVTLTWNEVENAETYLVKWYDVYDELLLSDFCMEKETSLTSMTVTGLDSNTKYVFYVFAKSTKAKSDAKSEPKGIITPAE